MGGVDAGSDLGAADASVDAGAPDGGHDAGLDAGMVDAGADAGPMCTSECTLFPLDPVCAAGTGCRMRDGCSTRCTTVFRALSYGADCLAATDCSRGMQCLARPTSGSGTCYAFCRIGHNEDCTHGAMECVLYTDMRTIDRGGPDDDVDVVFPAGFGVCR